jgi:uncharacterized protein YjcR
MANVILTGYAAHIRLRKMMNIPSVIAVQMNNDSRESSRARRNLEIVLELFVRRA